MATTRTALRCVTWVNSNDHAPMCLRFISQQRTQAVERPLVHGASLLFAMLLRVASDFYQVLNRDDRARRNGLYQLPADNVIAIQAKPGRPPRQPFEMPLSGFCAFALKRTLQPEISTFSVFPRTFTKKLIVRCNGRTDDTKVHTDHIPIRNEFQVRQGDDHIQPESAFAKDQIRAIECNALRKQSPCIRIQVQFNNLSASNRSQRNTVLMIGIGTGVIANRADIALGALNRFENWIGFATSMSLRNLLRKLSFFFDLPRESRPDCFGCLRSGRDHQLSRQPWKCFSQRIVCCLMQLHTILFSVFPSKICHSIEAFCILQNGFKQYIELFYGWQ